MIQNSGPTHAVKYLIFFYGALGIVYWILFLSPGNGDEGLISLYLAEGTENGFQWLIQTGDFSVPYSLVVYPLSWIFPSYMALRIGGLLGLMFLYFYLNHRLKYKSQGFRNHLLFYLFSGSFLLGTNDNLLFCLLTVFFTEVFLVLEKRQQRIPLYAWACVVTALFTREMTVIYIPVMLLGMYMAYYQKRILRKEFLAVLVTIVFWIGLNIPSLLYNQRLGFDNKNTNDQEEMTWVQRQYLSQRYANEGKIPQFQHVSWEETMEYIQQHGEESLPRTNLEALFFDFLFTLKEFVTDFIFTIYAGFRQSGLAVFFPAIGFILYFKSRNPVYFFLASSQLLIMLIVSFLIISYVEIRWMSPVFIMGILGLEKAIQSQYRKLTYLDVSNQYILLALGLYGCWRYISLIKGTEAFQSLI